MKLSAKVSCRIQPIVCERREKPLQRREAVKQVIDRSWIRN